MTTCKHVAKVLLVFAIGIASDLANGQTLPPEIPDFDRTFGFATPTLATVIRTFGDANLYGIVPNQLNIMTKVGGAPDISFIHTQGRSGGYFVINVEVTLNEEKLAAVQEEVKKQNPAAKFIILEPVTSEFRITIPGSDTSGAVAKNVKAVGPRRFSATFVVDDIVRRIMLLPVSDHFDFFAVTYDGKYRGVLRDEAGNPKIAERSYSIGSTFGGSCAVFPETVVELPSGREGCQFPTYPVRLVSPIQKGLSKLGIYKSKIDGNFGPITYRAIQSFQKNINLRSDGIPSTSVLEAIESKTRIVH